MRRVGLVVLGALGLCALPAVQAQSSIYQRHDLLGGAYQAATFAPCREWGCHELSRTESGVTVQLLGLDVRLKLSLSPSGRVLGMEAVTLAQGRLNTYWSRLTRQAFGLTLTPQQFAGCFAELRGAQASRVLHGGGGEHYGVQCFRRSGYQGIRLYFDW